VSRKTRKILGSLVVLGLLGGLAGLGAFSAFTATTTNSGNSIASGTVQIDQHAGATTMINVSNQKPGDTVTKCVRVTYTGSLASSVKLYSTSVTNGTNYTVRAERGSGLSAPAADMNCTGFSSSSDAYATGDLGSFATTYAGGYDGKAGGTAWATNDAVDYRFTFVTKDDTTANAHTTGNTFPTGSFSYTWEARNN
jgi:hypothetical protein